MDQALDIKPSIYGLLKKRIFFLRSPWKDIILFLILVVIIIWFMSKSTEKLGYYWQWYRVPQFLFKFENGRLVAGQLIKGLFFTFRISGISLLFMSVIGLTTALLRLSNSFMGRVVSRGYLETIRNTPLIVQIYLIYFVVGPIIGLGRFGSAVMALSLFEGAYTSEILRAGIVSIPKGQWEAAYSLGLSTSSTYRDIILPQAIRRILPPLTSQVITLIKDSALVSVVSLSDLALEARIISTDTFLTFEIWFTAAAIYLMITIPLSTVVYGMEKRFKILT